MGFKTSREIRLEKLITKAMIALEANQEMISNSDATIEQFNEAKLTTESAVNEIITFWDNDSIQI